jgi:hypothetical protein
MPTLTSNQPPFSYRHIVSKLSPLFFCIHVSPYPPNVFTLPFLFNQSFIRRSLVSYHGRQLLWWLPMTHASPNSGFGEQDIGIDNESRDSNGACTLR